VTGGGKPRSKKNILTPQQVGVLLKGVVPLGVV